MTAQEDYTKARESVRALIQEFRSGGNPQWPHFDTHFEFAEAQVRLMYAAFNKLQAAENTMRQETHGECPCGCGGTDEPYGCLEAK
jgi:hypothetical protein